MNKDKNEKLLFEFPSDKRSLYLGSDIDEFVSLFKYNLSWPDMPKLLMKKEEVMEWLSKKCPKEIFEYAKPFYHSDLREFILALEYLRQNTKTKKLSLDMFVGYSKIKEILKPLIHSYSYGNKELLSKFKVLKKSGVLLYGPPGCGKSYLSKCFSDELNYCFINPSPAVFKFHEGTALLPKLFSISKKMRNAFLYFDDVDNLCTERNLTNSSLTNSLLFEIDGYNIEDEFILAGSTNYPEKIDSAFYRPGRFEKTFYIKLPDENTREELFKFYLKEIPIGSIDFKELSEKSNFCSCADIKHFCSSASFDCYIESVNKGKIIEITQEKIIKHLNNTNPSGKKWFEDKKTINFGPFEELFSELIEDIEKYKEVNGNSNKELY